MVGLDVTLQARATPDVQDRMRGLGRLGADLLLPGLLGYRGDPPGATPARPARRSTTCARSPWSPSRACSAATRPGWTWRPPAG